MNFGSFKYLVKQGWRSMAANRFMTLASIGVLTVCLVITGLASLVSINVRQVVQYLNDQNEIRVYIVEGTTEEDQTSLGNTIVAMDNVEGVVYVSKEDAFNEMTGMMGEEYGTLLQGYNDVFPSSYRVAVPDLSRVRETAAALRALPNVDEVNTSIELADVMVTLNNAVTYGGLAIIVLLALVSIIIISNTIRLTVFARRREISIMKYVGATNAFIRLPFFVEGMTVGAIAGILGSGIVCLVYYFAMEYLTGMSALWLSSITANLLPLSSIWYYLLGAFVLFGVLVGGIGTVNSMRKHLKV